MTRNAWIIFIGLCVVLFGGLLFFTKKDTVDVSKIDNASILAGTPDSGNIGDHVFGNKNAKTVLIEYGDYQCPGCGSMHPIVKKLTEKYSKDILFVFRNFPLTQIHPNARFAAAAAEAAGKEGKFWEMHNIIYENQKDWSDSQLDQRAKKFEMYATAIGIKQSNFTNTLQANDKDINKKIDFDAARGRKANVDATPTFFLNGKKLEQTDIDNEQKLEDLLKKSIQK